jgi:hypothetical protein
MTRAKYSVSDSRILPGPELQAAFRQRLIDCSREAEMALKEADFGDEEIQLSNPEVLRDILHKLAGASSLYGHAEVGEAAAHAELALCKTLDGSEDSHMALNSLRTCLAELIKRIAEAL